MPPIEVTLLPRDAILRLVVAVLVGAVLGINRDLHDKPAGLRTHSLVTLGSALLTLVTIQAATGHGAVDLANFGRVAQGIVTGIGFLGGGVILRGRSEQNIQGLTTAASIWLAACLGIACGAGTWTVAGTAVGLTLLILATGGPIEDAIYRRWHHARPRGPESGPGH